MADVFISYATEDSHRATEVAEALVSSGVLVWLEPRFQGRSLVAAEIKNQLSRARCVLTLWSHHSVRSMWVRDQANAGRERGALLPVLIEPLDARQEVPAEFRDMPYEDLSAWNGDSQGAKFVKLTERIKRTVDSSPTPAQMPGKTVFVCYRRQDAEHAAGRLHEKLVSVYGSERVFMDTDSVPLGVNFVTRIREQLQGCGAVLVIVGRSWTTITDPKGSRRLEHRADHVRVEVATALKQRTLVIPVLVQGASAFSGSSRRHPRPRLLQRAKTHPGVLATGGRAVDQGPGSGDEGLGTAEKPSVSGSTGHRSRTTMSVMRGDDRQPDAMFGFRVCRATPNLCPSVHLDGGFADHRLSRTAYRRRLLPRPLQPLVVVQEPARRVPGVARNEERDEAQM